MGRELQKKKRRSGRAPIRQSNRTKKILNPRGNNVIAKNWDKKETLSQNYRRLGLLARLKGPTGGTEKQLGLSSTSSSSSSSGSKKDPFAIPTTDKAIVSEVQVERSSDGKITRILSAHNPLNDPLNALSDDEKNEEGGEEAEEWGGIRDDGVGTTEVVRSLIEEARNPAPAKVRYQSELEREWLERLVARHGEDYRAMARDVRLNPMQQTAADIARRIRKMNA